MSVIPLSVKRRESWTQELYPGSITFARKIIMTSTFDYLFLLAIIMNTLVASISCQNRTPVTDYIGLCMTCLFALFTILKILGLGITFMKDSWNILMFLLVFAAVMADVNRMGSGQYILVVLFFRVLRAIKLLRRVPQIRISMAAIMASMTVLSNFALTLFLFICPTAIMLTAYIGQNSNLSDKTTAEGTKNYELWGSVPRSMLSLFQIATLDWGDIVRASIMDEPYLAFIFISFILATGFAVSNVFITIIGNIYTDMHEAWENELDDMEDFSEKRKRADLLERMKKGLLTDNDMNIDTLNDMKLTNADIALMLLSIQQQLNDRPRAKSPVQVQPSSNRGLEAKSSQMQIE